MKYKLFLVLPDVKDVIHTLKMECLDIERNLEEPLKIIEFKTGIKPERAKEIIAILVDMIRLRSNDK